MMMMLMMIKIWPWWRLLTSPSPHLVLPRKHTFPTARRPRDDDIDDFDDIDDIDDFDYFDDFDDDSGNDDDGDDDDDDDDDDDNGN